MRGWVDLEALKGSQCPSAVYRISIRLGRIEGGHHFMDMA